MTFGRRRGRLRLPRRSAGRGQGRREGVRWRHEGAQCPGQVAGRRDRAGRRGSRAGRRCPARRLRGPPSRPPARARFSNLRTLGADLDRIFDAPALASGFWGVAVEDAGDRPADLPAQRRQAAATGVQHEDPDAGGGRAAAHLEFPLRHEKLFAAGPIDAGTLHGDLVAIGSGDPTVDDFRRTDSRSELAASASRSGIEGCGRLTAA